MAHALLPRRMMRITCFVVVALVVVASSAAAQGFYSSSPGALTRPHASLDGASRCDDCHVSGSKAVDDGKCKKCHDGLGQKIGVKGFHASSLVRGQECRSCHHEHRPINIIDWGQVPGGQDALKEDKHGTHTGYPLRGTHAKTACEKCHTKTSKFGDRLYMGVTNTCGGCHAKEQPHGFTNPQLLSCERCHLDTSWRAQRKPLDFNHDDRSLTNMPLIGEHRAVACAKCHPRKLFNLPFDKPTACDNAGCHRSTHDKHLFGTKPCEQCHSPSFKSFRQQTAKEMPMFKHTARFELGNHEKLKCKECHTDARGESKPGIPCQQCHAKDSRHGTRFDAFGGSPPLCSTCHRSTSWRPPQFDHSRTKLPLTAKHAAINCRACHRGTGPADWENFTKDPSCKGCHKHRTAHADAKHPDGRWASAACLKCHRMPGDKTMRSKAELEKEFHGPSSDFPLVKKHKGKDCTLCHRTRAGTTSFGEESPECGDRCHQDSLHKGSLGKKCTPCHTSGSWSAEIFDHDKPFPDGGEFKLVGEHKNNKCEKCHPTKEYKGTERNCSPTACHAQDDAHKGRLGACGRCHVPDRSLIFNHNTMSEFRLDGKHLQVRCMDCHPSITFKPRPKTCFGCHPEPAVHKGQYGIKCEQCHTTRTWGDVKPLHDVGDFSLKGSHNQVACERCHRDSRPLGGSGNLCINCHRNDDIHSNSLSPRCGECHTQWSFAPARFDHSRVGCNLTGLHRTLSCFGCHRNGNFAGLSGECVGCHRDDALRVQAGGTVPDHKGFTTCSNCHNPNVWKPATSFNRESVCR